MVRNFTYVCVAALIGSVLASACGGGGTKTVVRTVGPDDSPPAVVTGDGSIDLVIDRAMKVNDIALAGLTGYEHVPCKKGAPEELGGAPACRENEADGTPVEVLASSACTDGWVRPEQVPDAYRYLLAPEKPEVVLVFKPRLGANLYGEGFGAQVAIALRTKTNGDGTAGGAALHITDGRISWIESNCNNLGELIAPDRVEAVIFDPKNPPAAASPTVQTPIAEATAQP